MGKVLRQYHRHLALLKMARQQRETREQAQQVRKDHPFVPDVRNKSHCAIARFKPGENDFVDSDCHQACERNTQGVMMKHRNAKESQPE